MDMICKNDMHKAKQHRLYLKKLKIFARIYEYRYKHNTFDMTKTCAKFITWYKKIMHEKALI